MNNKYIDLDLSETILNNINSGMYDNIVPTEVSEIPGIDGNSIIDRTGLKTWCCELNDAL